MKFKKLTVVRICLLLLGLFTFMALGFFEVLSGRIRVSEMFSADLASSFLQTAGILILIGFIYLAFTLRKYLNSPQNKVIKIFLVAVVIIDVLDNCYRYYALSGYLSDSFLNIYFLGSLVFSLILYITVDLPPNSK